MLYLRGIIKTFHIDVINTQYNTINAENRLWQIISLSISYSRIFIDSEACQNSLAHCSDVLINVSINTIFYQCIKHHISMSNVFHRLLNISNTFQKFYNNVQHKSMAVTRSFLSLLCSSAKLLYTAHDNRLIG